MAMGDRIVVLHQGTVRQIGTPKQVYDVPADAFVATFLGSPPMNLFESGDVTVGFRPEHLVPLAAAGDAALTLQLRAQNLEYLGSEWILYARIEAGPFADREVVVRLPAGATGYAIDQSYTFGIRREHFHFFDAATQKRVAARAEWP
jgi:multiple sugar transport system ATP-binding protein